MQRIPSCQNCFRNFELQNCRPLGNRIPLLLPCGHTFCEGCILKAAKNSSEISCFKCDEIIKLKGSGEEGVQSILPNIYILGLLLYNWRIASEKITGGNISEFNGYGNVVHKFNSMLSSNNGSTCEEEEEDESSTQNICEECCKCPPSCKCKICDSKFCEKCFRKVHQTTRTLKKHKPSPIELETVESEQLCPHHNRKLEFFDKVTLGTVCAICIISEKCRGHEVILLKDMKNNQTKIPDGGMKSAKETLFWLEHTSDTLKKEIKEKCMDADFLFQDIQNKFNEFHSKLQSRQLQLMRKATEKMVFDSSINGKLLDVKSNIDTLNSLVKKVDESRYKGDNVSEEALEKLNTCTDIPCIIDMNSFSTLDDEFQIKFDKEVFSSFDNFGVIEQKKNENLFTLKKISDVSKEVQEKLKNDCMNKIVNDNGKKSNELTEIVIDEENIICKQLVCVTDFKDPHEFKVQCVCEKQRLQSLMTNLNKYCRYANSSENLVQYVEVGQLFCAQFLSDNNWYRASVTNKSSPDKVGVEPTWSNGLTVEVIYIDYGNKERVPLTRLRQIPKEYLEIPALALSCSFVNIQPQGGLGTEWTKDTKKAFETLTGDYPLIMTTYKRKGVKHFVDLCRYEIDEKSQKDNDYPSSVRDGLVFLEVASMLSSNNSGTRKTKQKRHFVPHNDLIVNEFVDVTVTHVVDPDAIYLQMLTSQVADDQYHLGQVYTNTKNKNVWKIDYPYKNMICSAKYSVDKAWYRAQVLKVNKKDSVVVEFVDYGNREIVSISDLRRIPDMYVKTPKQCIKVKLSNVKYPKGKSKWTKKMIIFLQKFFVGKSLVAVVKAFDKEVPLVELYDTSTEEDINMNELLQKFVSKEKNEDPVEEIVSTKLKKMVLKVEESEKDKSVNVKNLQTRFCYLPAEVPISNRFSATGFHVDDDANIFLHVMNSNDMSVSDIMHHLNFDTNKFTNCILETTKGLQLKEAIVGKFSKDGLLYRAEILQIVDKERLIVNFVDIGVVEETTISNIFSEPVLLEIPRQTLSVSLSDIVPINDKWSSSAISLLEEYIVGEIVDVEIQMKDKNFLTAIINVDDGSNMADILVKEGMAVFVKGSNEMLNMKTVESLDYLWFTEQKLPKKGLKFPVTVTQVNQPDIVYIQRLPVDEEGSFCGSSNDETATDAFNNLMLLGSLSEIINRKNFFKGQSLKLKPAVGMACVSMYSSDGVYYRAMIEQIFEEKNLVEVIYVDYGTSEVVTLDCLLPLPPDLIHLPMQSTKVKVSGIKPIKYDESAEMLRDTRWSIEAMKFFFSIVADKRLIAEVVSDDDELPSLHLYLSLDEDRILKYVGHVLKDSKLAEFEI